MHDIIASIATVHAIIRNTQYIVSCITEHYHALWSYKHVLTCIVHELTCRAKLQLLPVS